MSYNVTKLKINCYATIPKNCNIYFIIIMSKPLAGGTIGSCYCLLQVVCCFSSLSHLCFNLMVTNNRIKVATNKI